MPRLFDAVVYAGLHCHVTAPVVFHPEALPLLAHCQVRYVVIE
jgi:hypothetical protein